VTPRAGRNRADARRYGLECASHDVRISDARDAAPNCALIADVVTRRRYRASARKASCSSSGLGFVPTSATQAGPVIVHPCNRRAAVARIDPEAPETIASRAAGLKTISGKFAGIGAAVGVTLINATCHHLNEFPGVRKTPLDWGVRSSFDRSGLPTMPHASETNPGAPAEMKGDLVDGRHHENRTKVFTRYLLTRC